MDFLRNTHIDFMKYRRFWLAFSAVVMAIGLVSVFFFGKLNLGIDFAGGTQLTLKFRAAPDLQELRALVASAGVGDPQIQRFGAVGANEVMVRTPIVPGTEEGSAAKLQEVLSGRYNADAGGKPDLNQIGSATVAQLLAAADPDHVGGEPADRAGRYEAEADALLAARKKTGIFVSWDEVTSAPGVSPAAASVLRSQAAIGSFAVLATENVGPQVGSELRQRGLLAVIGSLFGMLIYIWIRFELRFAIGATMASLHDVLITLGIYAYMGYEFNLTTIAAFLTLVGYSVNDTVVTFDRMRENMRKSRGRNMLTMLNDSLNQMLSRTLLTGGTAIAAAFLLWQFGGEAIKGFAFILFAGIIIGTYSSIYIASPFALFWEEWFGANGRFRRSDSPAKSGRPSAPKR